MRVATATLGVALLLLNRVNGWGQAVPLTAGQYDVTISGLPGGNSESRARCITPDHLKNPEAIFTYAYNPKAMVNPSVKVNKFSADGGRISYEAETPVSRIKVSGTLSSTGFAVDRVTSAKSGKGTPVTMKLEGNRSGACPGH